MDSSATKKEITFPVTEIIFILYFGVMFGARAVVKNAPIMLTDEATSALDPWTEKRVLNAVMKSDEKKIIIVTAHRQSVMDLCNRIYRVSEGHVTEVTEDGDI